jgi:peptidoglycan/xylan/chitin deacetylase (PgdA/CDA1 family)
LHGGDQVDKRLQSFVREVAEKQLTNEVKDQAGYQEATKPVYTTDSGFLSLTIDDGPSTHTDELLDILEQKQARAIFFMLGENIV